MKPFTLLLRELSITINQLNIMANINENEKQCQSQAKMIRAWLESGRTITWMDALHLFGCGRLASRINDLKNQGMNIDKTIVTGTNGKRYAEYFLKN